jgi:tricarballylate dehydrogenase
MRDDFHIVDVAVLGGGNAGLCAALNARRQGARVVLVESAPYELRGGNSRHTRNLRCAHDQPTDVLRGAYTEEEFVEDVIRVTKGRTDEALTRLLVRESTSCPEWMGRFGGRLQPALRGTLHLDRTNAFFLGGGRALMNAYYTAAARLGVRIMYGTEALGLDVADRGCRAISVCANGRQQIIRARAVVLAAGGFESNLEWLAAIWGKAADNFVVRGTRYNTGTLLKQMLDRGVQPVGEPAECHAIAVDARAPKFDGGIVTRLDSLPLGIVVNRRGERFYDEGEDVWPKRYAIWGRLIAAQPDQLAYSIVDAKVAGLFLPSVFPPVSATSIRELASGLDLPPDALDETVRAFNSAVVAGSFDRDRLDSCRTEGLSPSKSHWALPLDRPPFWGYPLRPGITFTYLGVKVDETARVIMADGHPAPNLFAAGEIMAGNILGTGYVAGVGMTIGTVFGRIAGREAAAVATL